MFNAGNICNHYFLLTFLQSICSQHLEGLSHHIAKKKISFIDNKGQRIEPTEVNGMKMEKFVFDVFKYSK
jgi:UDP-N-acetylglucosamine/UDP-N-acetylgalactosamine diphosphorylase